MGFQEDIRIMRESYYELERRFIEINRIIPFDNSGDTYSPRLYDILQTTCGQVENMLRLICDEMQSPCGNNPGFPKYYETLNSTGILERQIIDYFSSSLTCKPFFVEPDQKSPFWWRSYNKTKHNLPQGYKEGNLTNTVFALSGAYALHCIAEYCKHAHQEILNNSEWMDEDAISMRTLQPTITTQWIKEDVRPRSDVFYPVSYYRPLGGL